MKNLDASKLSDYPAHTRRLDWSDNLHLNHGCSCYLGMNNGKQPINQWDDIISMSRLEAKTVNRLSSHFALALSALTSRS